MQIPHEGRREPLQDMSQRHAAVFLRACPGHVRLEQSKPREERGDGGVVAVKGDVGGGGEEA